MDFGKVIQNRTFQYLALAAVLFVFLIFLLSEPTGIANQVTNVTCTGNVTFDFYYSPTCPHCQAQEAFMPVLENEFPQVTFVYHDIADNQSEYALLVRQLSIRGLPTDQIGTPTTFICDRYFVGYESNQTTGATLALAISQVLAERKK
jgi:glutaredoxin